MKNRQIEFISGIRSNEMVSGKVMIRDLAGLHLTPAGKVCNEAIKYNSNIKLRTGNTEVNAKSVISLLSACVKCGSEVELVCEGEDEELALDNLINLMNILQCNGKAGN